MKSRIDKWVVSALAFNTLVWTYFWIAFFVVADRFDHMTVGQIAHNGVTAPLILGSMKFGFVGNPLMYWFFFITLLIQLPSVFLVVLVRLALERPLELSISSMFLGVNLVGWELLAMLLLSYVQWFYLGRAARWAWARMRKKA